MQFYVSGKRPMHIARYCCVRYVNKDCAVQLVPSLESVSSAALSLLKLPGANTQGRLVFIVFTLPFYTTNVDVWFGKFIAIRSLRFNVTTSCNLTTISFIFLTITYVDSLLGGLSPFYEHRLTVTITWIVFIHHFSFTH